MLKEYEYACDNISEVFGNTHLLATLGPVDFQRLRSRNASTATHGEEEHASTGWCCGHHGHSTIWAYELRNEPATAWDIALDQYTSFPPAVNRIP
jgi:hypothetical protein